MGSVLLWQPDGIVRRKKNYFEGKGNVIHFPSWVAAGVPWRDIFFPFGISIGSNLFLR